MSPNTLTLIIIFLLIWILILRNRLRFFEQACETRTREREAVISFLHKIGERITKAIDLQGSLEIIINFIMDTYTIVLRKIPDQKFGKIRKDGTIDPPQSMKYKSLKFLVVSWLKLTEKQSTFVLYGITMIFCVVGLIIF